MGVGEGDGHFWREFLGSNWGKEFVAGGCGGIAGVIVGHPLDTLRIRQQHAGGGSSLAILRTTLATEGSRALFRGMCAPLAIITFQNAIVFQSYASMSRGFDSYHAAGEDPPSYRGVALAGVGAGVIQGFLVTPAELVKIRLQLLNASNSLKLVHRTGCHKGSASVTKSILKVEGIAGLYRGLTITLMRDSPSYGVYFWTYEYMREQLHPGCRKSGQESLRTMLVAGGFAGIASWVCCYPLDVVKTRLQAQSTYTPPKYRGIADCFRKSVKESGYGVLFRGLGTAVVRAFLMNGPVFAAYELALKCMLNNKDQ